jgi:hypothetical protein
VANFMKATYPDEERPLGHSPEFTQRLKAGVEALVAKGVPRPGTRTGPPTPRSRPSWSRSTRPAQLETRGGYSWYLQTVEVSHNFVFQSADLCRSPFETLLRHNQLLGTPDSIR